MTLDDEVRRRVRERACSRCEYCSITESALCFVPFHVEHIIASQHIRDDSLENLALACDRCNAYKGTNLSSVDPDTKAIVPLFNPRVDVWNQHFKVDAGWIFGLTPTGRATARLLNMNARRRVQLRLLQDG